jgi:putative transposase
LPVGTQELDIIVAPSQPLTVGNEGIVTQYLRFNSPELQELRRRTAHSFKTVVKFDPESLGHVWVQDPKNAGWLMVPSCHPTYTDGLSIVQHRAIRAFKRDALKRSNADEVLLAAKTELGNMWNSRTVRGRRLKGEHLRAMSALTSSHALRFQDAAEEVSTAKIVCAEEMATPAREVPVFSGFQMA